MRSFVIPFSGHRPSLDSIRSGALGPEIVTLCRVVNVGLFLSGGLRRDTEVSLVISEANEHAVVITLGGNRLRRVSPDERSISFFISKAMKRSEDIGVGETVITDNGIVIARILEGALYRNWQDRPIYIASRSVSASEWPDCRPNGVFVYRGESPSTTEFHTARPVPGRRTPERFVLDINRWFDQRTKRGE
ncbi:MAG: hypothetical protein QXQ81_05170 [Candidatus Thorarchaeota archaeon]